jgi:hypothetical protein
MRKLRLLLLSVLLAVPLTMTVATPAQACTSNIDPDGCAVINRICHCLG